MKKAILVIILASVLLLCCTQYNEDHQIIDEAMRLQNVSEDRNLTQQDLQDLSLLIGNDSYAQDELHEISIFVKYNETLHAGHGLGFIADYYTTGEKPVCPLHELAHYYVFTKHNETALAQASLANARRDLPVWQQEIHIDPARNIDQTIIDQASRYFQEYNASIAQGNNSITPDELDFMTFLGGIC